MSYLFVQTLVIQLFVGVVFLLLGLWGGKFLWGGERQPSRPAPGPSEKEKATDRDASAAEAELKRLRARNGELEKENRKLKAKSANATTVGQEPPGTREVEETLEVVRPPVETDGMAGKGEKSVKPEKPVKAAAGSDRDDLIQIRGIGKVMAEKLQKKGIVTYRQIAEWTKEEIAKLPYGTRVTRDKWQVQARRLHREKYGDRI